MSTKQVLNDCYERIITRESDGMVLNVYRAMTMKSLPKSLTDYYNSRSKDNYSLPYKGMRLETESVDFRDCEAQVLNVIHGKIVDVYVCAILVRPFGKDARKEYDDMMGRKPSERIRLMWDSRNLGPQKKRVRPTLRQVRGLEAERDDLKKSLDIALGQCTDKDKMIKSLNDDLSSVCTERDTLLKSNKLMEQELIRLRRRFEEAEKGWEEGKEEVERLMNRGFWARVFNK